MTLLDSSHKDSYGSVNFYVMPIGEKGKKQDSLEGFLGLGCDYPLSPSPKNLRKRHNQSKSSSPKYGVRTLRFKLLSEAINELRKSGALVLLS